MNETISTARAQSDGYLQIIGPDSYERIPPNLYGLRSRSAEIKRYTLGILAEAGVQTPPEELYLLHNAYVAALPLVFTHDGEIFAPSLIDHHTVHPLEFFVELAGGIVQTMEAPAAFIFKAGTANYGHVLVEMLPKLENIVPILDQPIVLLVPPLAGGLREELEGLVDELYPGKFIVELMRSPIVRVRELVYPGPVSRHNTRKSRTLIRFADRLLRLAASAEQAAAPRRIYVSREATTNRRLLNEAEIRAEFEERGYQAIHPESMTLRQQATTFAAATHIAGPLGAGLTNVVFAAEQADVVMIDPGLHDYFYWDLACLRGQNFTWHFAAPLRAYDVGRLHADYRVPVEPVRRMLGELAELE